MPQKSTQKSIDRVDDDTVDNDMNDNVDTLDEDTTTIPNDEDLGIIALFDAIDDGDVEEVQRLLQTHQYNLEERDALNDTPLLKACIGGNLRIIGLLLMYGAEVNVENTHFLESRTPISTAITHMDVPLLHLLVPLGAKLPDELDEATNFDTAKFLFEHGVKISNECLLKSITEGCDVKTVRILIDAGVDVNYIDAVGNNALHYACKYNTNPLIIQTLINSGVDKDAVNKGGKKPTDMFLTIYSDDDVYKNELARKIINREESVYVDETPTIFDMKNSV